MVVTIRLLGIARDLQPRPGKYTSQVVFTINEVFQATFLLLPASNELSHSIVLRFVPASQQRRIF